MFSWSFVSTSFDMTHARVYSCTNPKRARPGSRAFSKSSHLRVIASPYCETIILNMSTVPRQSKVRGYTRLTLANHIDKGGGARNGGCLSRAGWILLHTVLLYQMQKQAVFVLDEVDYEGQGASVCHQHDKPSTWAYIQRD